jgi:hypothetical protein
MRECDPPMVTLCIPLHGELIRLRVSHNWPWKRFRGLSAFLGAVRATRPAHVLPGLPSPRLSHARAEQAGALHHRGGIVTDPGVPFLVRSPRLRGAVRR